MSENAGGDVEDPETDPGTDPGPGTTTPPPDPAPQEPIPVDPSTPPADVIRALGYDPDHIQSLVVTSTSVVAVAADYPDPHVEVTDGDR